MFDIRNMEDEELCLLAVEQIATTKSSDKWKCQDLFPNAQWKQVSRDTRMRVGAYVFAYSIGEGKNVIEKLDKNSQNQQMWKTIASEAELKTLRNIPHQEKPTKQ